MKFYIFYGYLLRLIILDSCCIDDNIGSSGDYLMRVTGILARVSYDKHRLLGTLISANNYELLFKFHLPCNYKHNF